uniref:Retrotransposon protein, putative, Ty1-copia subclass n=1 Tax=Tanacetum cinerariifolium TaxID=118510 RepID=A0A699GW88_TANCI|nr:hypothetical protein [Tanacetum cinerariifolium]
MLKLHEETLPKKDANPALHAIRAGRVQKNQKNKPHKADKGGHGESKGRMGYVPNNAPFAPKPKTPPPPKKDNPAKDAICHQCSEIGHWRRNCPVYLPELMKKNKLSQGASTSGSKKLKLGALSLYVGHGHRAAIGEIGTYHLELPSGLVIVLYNCHYTRGISKGSRNQLGKTIKSLRSDRGGKYTTQEFLDHLKEHRIIVHHTPPYTPQNNEVSERRNRTLLDMVRSMTSQTTLPKSFWDYALETAARILNMVPTKKVEKTPYKETMGYSFYSISENKVFVAWNAEFFESKLLDLKASKGKEDLKLIQEEDTNPSIDTSLNNEEDDQEIDEPQSDINPIRRSARTCRPTDQLCLYIDAEEYELGDLGEPANYKAALLDLEYKKWLNAMNVEMQSMKYNDVWVLVKLPPNARTIGSKWLFKKKTDIDGEIYVFKAHLVAEGFTQTYGVDYEETFSRVVDIRAIRILIAIAVYYDYEIWQMDVKTAFLYGHLSEEVYMEQPEGFVNPKYPNHVCKLKRSIYGLKQASRSFVIKDLGDAAYILGIKNRGEEHWTAVKNILKYLRNTKDMFLEVVWICKFIFGLGIVLTIKEPKSMYCENTKAIEIAKDDGVTKDARHFRAKVYYLHETIKLGDVKIEKIDTYDNLADPFTKALAVLKHSELTRNIRLLPASSFM